jgi:hypothetical protein
MRAARDFDKEPVVSTASLSSQNIACIRQLRFIWIDAEAGAPSVDPEAPFGSNEALRDVAEITGEADETALERLYVEAMNALREFAAVARLAPGRYVLPAPIVTQLKKLMSDPEGAGIDEEGGFQFDAEHAKLIAALRWVVMTHQMSFDPIELGAQLRSGRFWLVTSANCKRPYGDMTYCELDMAEILGLPVDKSDDEYELAPELDERLYRLHQRMHIALQVFVRHASM